MGGVNSFAVALGPYSAFGRVSAHGSFTPGSDSGTHCVHIQFCPYHRVQFASPHENQGRQCQHRPGSEVPGVGEYRPHQLAYLFWLCDGCRVLSGFRSQGFAWASGQALICPPCNDGIAEQLPAKRFIAL